MPFLRKYATATHIYLPIIKRAVVDFAVSTDWTPASGDVKVSIDGGAAANIGTLPSAVTMGNTAYWDFTIATGEVTGKKIIVTVADSATKAVEDQSFVIETYGHASAEYQADLSAANLPANVSQWSGTNVASPDTAGYPKVTHKTGSGAGELDITSGIVKSNLAQILGTAITETAGQIAAGFKKLFDVAAPVFTLASVNQTGDNYARLGAPSNFGSGATFAGNTVDINAALTTLNGRLTAARAGYLDNLNVGGVVASQNDINSLNQSASRRVIITSVPQYERPESGSSTYQLEARTYDGDGAAVNADSTPTLAATGLTSGDLSANLSAASNSATGVYRWTYTVASGATLEQIRFDVSATISSSAFPLAIFAQVCDFVSATFTSTDQSHLTSIYNKLPSKNFLAGTSNADGDVQLDEATGTPADSAGTGTLLSRLTGQRATNLDNLDAAVSSRSSHTAADVWAVSTRTLSSFGTLVADIWANATAVAFIAANAAIKVVTDKLATMLQTSGANYQYTTDALENAPGGGAGGVAGSGSIEYQETVYEPDSSTPLSGAEVWVSTDAAGSNVVAGTLTTDDFGHVTFMLDAGTYYFWVDHPNYNFDNPETVTVS